MSHELGAQPDSGAIDSNDTYLPAKQVRARYGNPSDMTIYRWLADDGMAFPKPIYLGRLRYWRLRDLIAWERSRASSRGVA